jgi:hypothetical protein
MTSDLVQHLIIFLENLSLVIGNILLYHLFSIYLGYGYTYYLQILLYVLISVASFIVIGKNMVYWKSFLWLTLVSLVFIIDLSILYRAALFLISVIVPVMFALLYIVYQTKQDKKELKLCTNSKKKIKKYFIAGMVFPRLLFFNVAHFFFPLLVIWIGFIGLIYLLGHLAINNFNNFVGIMSLMGIIFGLFQYYVKSYKENIQTKLSQYVAQITQSQESYSLRHFKDFLSMHNEHSDIEKKLMKIEKSTFPVKNIQRQYPDIAGYIKKMSKTIKQDNEIIAKLEEDKKDNHHLINAYKDFFDERKEQIIENLEDRNIKEFLWFLMGNINLFGEAQVMLSTLPLFEEDVEPQTYQDFIKRNNWEILNSILQDFIFG